MIAYKSKWQNKDTFKLMPINNECPYTEAIFIPDNKMLVVISKDKLQKPTVIGKLDDYGMPLTKGGKQVLERRNMDAYVEYYLEDMKDITSFLDMFAYNSNESYIQEILTVNLEVVE
jgi:hypothetical protein